MHHAIRTRRFARIAATTILIALVAGCATTGTPSPSDAALSGDEAKIRDGSERVGS